MQFPVFGHFGLRHVIHNSRKAKNLLYLSLCNP